jgi:hypothetical protein
MTADSASSADARYAESKDSSEKKMADGTLDAKHVAAVKTADGDDEAAVYYTGWRLAAIMGTINLSTLIASLDLVSIVHASWRHAMC